MTIADTLDAAVECEYASDDVGSDEALAVGECIDGAPDVECDYASDDDDSDDAVDIDLCTDSAAHMSVPEPAVAAGEKSSSVYLSIISQQTFIGCWKLNTELSNLLNVSLDQLQNSTPVKVSFTQQ